MKPEVDQILFLTTGQLMNVVIPQLPPGYVQGNSAVLAILTLFAAQEYDRAAEIRAVENAEMRALFTDTASGIDDAALKADLLKSAELQAASLRVSALNEVNYALRRVLIRLHAHAEEVGLGDLERRIWGLLRASADRRQLALPPA